MISSKQTNLIDQVVRRFRRLKAEQRRVAENAIGIVDVHQTGVQLKYMLSGIIQQMERIEETLQNLPHDTRRLKPSGTKLDDIEELRLLILAKQICLGYFIRKPQALQIGQRANTAPRFMYCYL
ncbi:unnamed protein product [Protopolystoma xenopodis]|uniref:Uncharacterized protein n=1 Tax=Protopolystoma xenopodis TaxID=117903 RepID=A0A3S5A1K7_9PLAT|nr:unnamed protein product [Protopolystoma xenopodis]